MDTHTPAPSLCPHITYVLHSAQMLGTERMALATLQELRTRGIQPLVIAPPGPVHAAAQSLGMDSRAVAGTWQMGMEIARCIWSCPQGAMMVTGVTHSLWVSLWRWLFGARTRHIHVVHGGTDERLSYGRKHWLTRLPSQFGVVQFVAVSEFVRQRLMAHGVGAQHIHVIENFLPATTPSTTQVQPPTQRAAFTQEGVHRVVLLTRIDRIKRVGLLLDALTLEPRLHRMQFDIYGAGEELDALRERARNMPHVRFHGFVENAAQQLAQADLLLHTCPQEPFGLALLEAFHAGVPVLAPDTGATADIVQHQQTGWHFEANNPHALARALLQLHHCPARTLNAVVTAARHRLNTCYQSTQQGAHYAELLGVRS